MIGPLQMIADRSQRHVVIWRLSHRLPAVPPTLTSRRLPVSAAGAAVVVTVVVVVVAVVVVDVAVWVVDVALPGNNQTAAVIMRKREACAVAAAAAAAAALFRLRHVLSCFCLD